MSPTPGRRKLVAAGYMVVWKNAAGSPSSILVPTKRRAEDYCLSIGCFPSAPEIFKLYRERVGGRGK